MARRSLPTPVLVIAIINIVLAAFGLFGVCCSLPMLLVMGSANLPGQQENPVADMMQKIPNYQPFMIFAMGTGLIVAVIQLSSGIGLLQRKPWGRTLAIIYAVWTIIQGTIGQIFNFIYIRPGLKAWTADWQRRHPSSIQMSTEAGEMLGYGVLVLTLCYVAYILFVMYQPDTIVALDPNAPEEPRDELFPHG